KVRLAPTSYAELVAKALPLVQDKLHEQQIKVALDLAPDLPPMQADQELLRNCLFNFITNGAQAMPAGGTITLGAAFDKESEVFRLTFADEGVGIAPEEKDKIFQPYFTTKEAGIGLGLAITERIVKEHGGTIEVESEPGKGTVFTVLLPAKVQKAA
ncbi:MAG TPA: ATP-binding protein, partial [Geobacteraceae bacterium]